MDVNLIIQLLQQLFSNLYYIHQSQPGKPIYLSKRFWTFVLGVVAVLLQVEFGWAFNPGLQMLVLAVVNFGVGLLTKSPTGFAWAPDNPEKAPGSAGQ